MKRVIQTVEEKHGVIPIIVSYVIEYLNVEDYKNDRVYKKFIIAINLKHNPPTKEYVASW